MGLSDFVIGMSFEGCPLTVSVYFWNLNRQRPRQNCLRRMEFVIDVEEYIESWKDGICLECRGGHISSEESVNVGVL